MVEATSMPPDNHQDPGLTYEQNLPLRWWQLPVCPDDTELSRLNEAALRILHVAQAWDESLPAVEGQEEPVARAYELVEFKVNLMLELISELLTRDQPLPIPAPVQLSSDGIRWKTARPPGFSEILRIEVYILPGVPKPLTLVAAVTSVERSDDLYRVHARFLSITDQVREALEKMIFRHHRRTVAEARRNTPPDTQ